MSEISEIEALARWWWNLTDEERQDKRVIFLERMRREPEFADAVMKILAEEKPYQWSAVDD